MSQTAISSLESVREKFFMNSTYIMSRKYESEGEMSLTAITLFQQAR